MGRRKNKLAIVPAEREGNGRHKRPSRAEMERRAEEARKREARRIIGVVLDQPHRKGNTDQRCESALGRFVIAHGLKPELYEGGNEFARIVHTWRRLKALPGVVSHGPGKAVTCDDQQLADKINRLAREMRDADSAMRPRDAAAIKWLLFQAGQMEAPDDHGEAFVMQCREGLYALAVHFRMLPSPR